MVSRSEDAAVREWAGLAYSVAARFDFPGADRDDVRQEALIALWQAQRSYDGTGTVRGHLALSVHRRLCARLREALRLKHRPLNEAASLTEPDGERGVIKRGPRATRAAAPHMASRDSIECASQTPGSVSDVLAPLTLAERRAVVGVACGMEYRELGSPRSVDNALMRARRKLREAA